MVVLTVGVGGRRAWEVDVEIPRAYGIYQPVGDSVLPGGISRAMRTIPVLVEIARDVQALCPDALFFNYSNPMTANCLAIRKATGLEVIGLCHGVFHVERQLAAFIGAPHQEVTTLYAGLNHLTFIFDLRWKGRDAWPIARARLEAERRDRRTRTGAGPDLRRGLRGRATTPSPGRCSRPTAPTPRPTTGTWWSSSRSASRRGATTA